MSDSLSVWSSERKALTSKGQSMDDCNKEPLVGDGVKSSFDMMQHLINEMGKSSQRIDEFNTDEFIATSRSASNEKHHIDLLYDEAWKSEDSDAASLKEVPVDFFDKIGGGSVCEDAVNSAIAEVSKDFLAGLRACTNRNQNGDSDESHLSSDTDFKLIKGMPAYAKYPETAAGLSDTDWNPYGTESDTNLSPRVPSQETPGNRPSGSKISAMISFNPPLHSTDLEAVTPSFAICSIPNTCTRKLDMHDSSEGDQVLSLKPDVTADFSSISHVSEQLFSPQKVVSEPVKLSDLNKTMRGNELEIFGKSSRSVDVPRLQRELASKPINKNVSSHYAPKSTTEYKTLERSYISVMDRAKMLGVPGDIVDGKVKALADPQNDTAGNDINICRHKPPGSEQGDTSEDDLLGQKVKKVLLDTKYLERDQEAKKTMDEIAIDYSSLQRDLQEIQESLNHNLGSGITSTLTANNGEKAKHKSTPPSSDNDGDIIPSTNTTPDRKRNRMAWDFEGDLTSEQISNHLEDEVSLNAYRNSSSSQRPCAEKQSYNSDGDETRTSGSSDKVDDHAAADQALAEMSAILRPHRQLIVTAAESGVTRGISSSQDVDEMLSNFRNQRRELESRYQQLSNPGLADKVFRILTTQDPEAQADGILSQVSAQERDERARYALNLHTTNLNFSSTDTDNLNTTNQSFSLPDDVRRRLDLSGLSSADGSRVADKSSFVLPSTKGFTAFDDMTKFLSSQMAKVSEKTFNHSLEMRIPPQVATCYPLFADHKEKDQEKGDEGTVAGVPSMTEQHSADLFSGFPNEAEPTATSSPIEALTDERKDESDKRHSSPENSDSSSEKRKEKYRPYRPAGSKDFYYTESDAASIADSVTTIESTHIGSDDARGPILPSSALGSRKDPPPIGGIYAKHKALSSVPGGESLPPIQEKSILDDQESEPNQSNKCSGKGKTKDVSGKDTASKFEEKSRENGQHSNWKVPNEASNDMHVHSTFSVSGTADALYSRGVAVARRDAQWDNRMRERGQDSGGHQPLENIEETVAKFTELSDLGSIGTYSQRPRINESDQPFDQGLTRDVGNDEPLSLRVKMSYTDNPEDEYAESGGMKKIFSREERKRQEFTKESTDFHLVRQRIKEREERHYPVYKDDSSHHYPSNYFEREDDFSAPRRRSWDQDSSSSPVRDARLSPAFHRALSAELRQAIEARSPLLSQNIERSLAQAPLETPAWQLSDNNKDEIMPRRSTSPPPTFLARERGQPPRDYVRSPVTLSRRSPPPAVVTSRPAWKEKSTESPVQQVRDMAVSPLPSQNSRLSSPPLLTENTLASASSFSKDQRARSLSPTYRDLSRAQAQMSPSLVEQAKSFSFPNSSLRTAMKNVPEQHSAQNLRQSTSPKRYQERTLENMTSESEDTDIDREPLSRRAQMLTAALPQERDISPDINSLWDRFKALNESNDSSMDSSRIEAITDLLRNPSRHLIAQYLKEREEYRIERQERAEADRLRRLKEQQGLGMPQLHSSSEDDINGGYNETRVKKEEERIKRRAAKKKKTKASDTSKMRHNLEGGKNKENIPDSLFSIPEDAGLDQSPVKNSTSQKSLKNKSDPNQQQTDHVIDPNMQKLREKISKQRGKIDKQTLKEFQRMEKLRKLEHLLSAKKHGQISNHTLEVQLGEMSSTSTPGSNSSGENENANSNSHIIPFSEDSTTAKDSSAEMHAWKAEKERRLKEAKLIEIDRRKEFKSQQNMETKEINKNTNRKLPTQHSKSKAQMSELKLLKLVNDGYLTPNEAYRLAVERAHLEGVGEESSICSNSSSEDLSVLNRPHRLYSPYARQDDFRDMKSKHIPKLKQLSPTTYVETRSTSPFRFQTRYQRHWNRQGNDEAEEPVGKKQPKPPRPTSPKLRSHRSGESHSRTSSQSPSSHQRKIGGSFKFHSLSRQNMGHHISSSKGSSSSPSRKYLPHHHYHHQQQQHGRERYPTRQDPCRYTPGIERPTSTKMKGVSWNIPMDLHPSKWEEPQAAAAPTNDRPSTMNSVSGSSLKKREQLPLPELPPSSPAEDNEEPVVGREKEMFGSGDGFWCKSDHPQGIPQELWQEVVSQDALASKTNHYEVDPLMDRVQYILNRENPAGEEEDPQSGMTLQEAFLARKQIFISKCRERQKRIALARENRHLQECLRLEREAIFAEQDRPLAPNLHAHPCSENLYHPKQRVFTKTEMKALTQKRYRKLHEVVQKQEKQKAEAELKLNRLRVQMFNKKVQRDVLKKTSIRRH